MSIIQKFTYYKRVMIMIENNGLTVLKQICLRDCGGR